VHLAAVMTGHKDGWLKPGSDLDFFDVKGAVERALDALLGPLAGPDAIRYQATDAVPYMHPGVCAEVALLKWGLKEWRAKLKDQHGVDYAKTPAEDFTTGMITFRNPETGQLVKGQFTNSWMFEKQGLRLFMDGMGPGYAFEINSLNSTLEVFVGDAADRDRHTCRFRQTEPIESILHCGRVAAASFGGLEDVTDVEEPDSLLPDCDVAKVYDRFIPDEPAGHVFNIVGCQRTDIHMYDDGVYTRPPVGIIYLRNGLDSNITDISVELDESKFELERIPEEIKPGTSGAIRVRFTGQERDENLESKAVLRYRQDGNTGEFPVPIVYNYADHVTRWLSKKAPEELKQLNPKPPDQSVPKPPTPPKKP